MQNVLTSTQPIMSQILSALFWFPDSVGITAAARWILLYFLSDNQNVNTEHSTIMNLDRYFDIFNKKIQN